MEININHKCSNILSYEDKTIYIFKDPDFNDSPKFQVTIDKNYKDIEKLANNGLINMAMNMEENTNFQIIKTKNQEKING